MSMIRNCGVAMLVIALCGGMVGCGNSVNKSTTAAVDTEEMRKEKQEKVDFLYNFVDSAKQNYDQAQQITWVDSVGTTPFGHKGIYTYMGIKGKEKTGSKWLRAVIHYSDSSWVFFDKVTFSNTEESWTYKLSGSGILKDKKTEVVMGGVHESIDISFDDIEKGLLILTRGENPQIDFSGRNGAVQKSITAAEIENIKTYMKLKEGIEAEKSLNRK